MKKELGKIQDGMKTIKKAANRHPLVCFCMFHSFMHSLLLQWLVYEMAVLIKKSTAGTGWSSWYTQDIYRKLRYVPPPPLCVLQCLHLHSAAKLAMMGRTEVSILLTPF